MFVFVAVCMYVYELTWCLRRLAKAIVSALTFEPAQRPSADNLLVCARASAASACAGLYECWHAYGLTPL